MTSITYVGNHDWCKACLLLAPILKEITLELNIPVRWLDTDKDHSSIAKLAVESLPTTIIYRGGLEVGRIVGAFPGHSMRRKILEHAI